MIAILLLLGIQVAQASGNGLLEQVPRWLRQQQHSALNDSLNADSLEYGNYSQKINHADPADTRSFNQRFFKDSALAQDANSSVLLVICGEWTCGSSDMGGAVHYYARELKAHRFALEHRYYGYSQPFLTLSTDNMQYLTTNNALADLKEFQLWAKQKYGLTGPWIVIGGSYAGSLAAYYRTKYPEMATGAWASSGPVEAREEFGAYDATVAAGVGPICLAKIQEVVSKLEASLNDPAQLAIYKQMFHATEIRDNLEFLYVVADMAAMAIQYGNKDLLCDGLAEAADPVAKYAQSGLRIFSMFGITPIQDTSQGVESLDPNTYTFSWGMRQWWYQSCTEYGYWQVANKDLANSARSQLIDLAHHRRKCAEIFGLPMPAQAQRMNDEFYEVMRQDGRTSNILLINGSTDPWAALSLTQERANNSNSLLSLFTVEGASHCQDLSTPYATEPASMKMAHELLMIKLKAWVSAPSENF